MDQSTDIKPAPKPSNSNTIPIRIAKPTARLLKSLLTTCNRKTYGKKVKADAVIFKALSLLDPTDIEEIQKSTYTSQDHLEIEYKKYCSTHGQISKSEFLKMILNTALGHGDSNFETSKNSKESETIVT
jgi:hypothetical protein